MLKKIVIFIVGLLVLFLIMNNIIMPLYVKHSDTVKVPKVAGMNYLEAKNVVEESGLEIIQGEVKYDENQPIGLILDQNPPADETVKYGRRIYVTICGGEQLAEVPNLRGRSLRDAKFTLEQRGLKIGETVRKNTNEFPEGYVISQIIQPGSKVKKNSSIELILSDGELIGDLKVPDVTGKNLEEAKKVITESKLKVGKITYQTNNDLPPGQIIDQYPKVSKSANENTTIDLFVARKKVIIQRESDEESAETENKNEADPGKVDDLNSQPDTKKPDPVPDNKKPVPEKSTDDIKKPDVKKEDKTNQNDVNKGNEDKK